MAIKSETGLETHPVGTSGLNGIVNGNWEQLNDLLGEQATITPSATPDITFNTSEQRYKTLALDQNVTFTTSSRATGRMVVVFLTCDGSTRNFTFPSWVWVGGTAPASIAANKRAILELWCNGAADTNVWARYTVES